MLPLAEREAERFGLGLKADFLGQRDPAAQEASERLGLKSQRLSSRAGHDAQALAAICPMG